MDDLLQKLPGMEKDDLEENMDELLAAVDDEDADNKDEKEQEEENEEWDEALLSKYPIFLTDKDGKYKCIFVYLHKLSSQIESMDIIQSTLCYSTTKIKWTYIRMG